jgi:hypothetical protein
MKTNFNYSAWLKNRSEKPATKVLPFSELTKVEKIAALLQLLGKSESDYEGVKIVSLESRPWGDLSTPAKLQVMNKRTIRAQELLKEGDTEAALKLLTSPTELDVCDVEVKTFFEASTLNSKIDYLLKEYGKPVEIVTVQLPCGQEWVDGLINYCKSLAVDPEPEAAKSDKEAAKSDKE